MPCPQVVEQALQKEPPPPSKVVAPKQQTVGDTFKKRAELAAALAAEKKARETLERLLEESPQKGEGADGVVGPSAGKGVELEREERMRKAREKLRKEKRNDEGCRAGEVWCISICKR